MAITSNGRERAPSGDRRQESYEVLVKAALEASFSGWNFDHLNGRVRDCELPWSYEELARAEITDSSRVLDLNTGELFAEILQGRAPTRAVATESWASNIPVAQHRLEALGIELRPAQDGQPLPAACGEFTLVLNHHGACDPHELSRVLDSGGIYLMQGVGRMLNLDSPTRLVV